jgi:hypothetical protein
MTNIPQIDEETTARCLEWGFEDGPAMLQSEIGMCVTRDDSKAGGSAHNQDVLMRQGVVVWC